MSRTLDRQRLWRALLTCTTCGRVVAVGPPEPLPAMAAYRLGADGGADARRHLGDHCPGGALTCTTEEEPPPVPQPPLVPGPPAPPPKGRRAPYAQTPARIMRGRR